VNDTRADTGAPNGLVSLRVAVEKALDVAAKRGERVFVVGGIVRDLLMRRAVGDHDLDLVVEGEGTAFARDLCTAIGGTLKVHAPFLTAKLSAPFSSCEGHAPFLDEVDVATARSESYERPGALPSVSPASIERDLWRRDFSVNAMALPLPVYVRQLSHSELEPTVLEQLVDPCGGYTALASRTVRILHPASFTDDPTRLFRAVRYCVRLSFSFDNETQAAFRTAVDEGALATISPRRVWNEVVSCFDEAVPRETIAAFVERGLFSHFRVIAAEALPRLAEAIDRLMVFRSYVESDFFAEAGKLLVVAAASTTDRAEIVKATQEKKTLLARAEGVAEGRVEYAELSQLLAAFGLHGTAELREALGDALGVSVS
jgi:tRNA nucleotidyltransferase/poly(A) polymerase